MGERGIHTREEIYSYLDGMKDAGGLPSNYVQRVVEKFGISEEEAQRRINVWMEDV